MSDRVTVLLTLEIDVTKTDGFNESDYCDYAMNWLGEAMDFDKTGTGNDGISWKGSFPSVEANYVIDREVVAIDFE